MGQEEQMNVQWQSSELNVEYWALSVERFLPT
jgi:hypothetical protein